jgi:glucose-1-phosphate thymidylyltransferase
VVARRTCLKIACLEEIGLKMQLLNKADISKDLELKKGEYYQYIKRILN